MFFCSFALLFFWSFVLSLGFPVMDVIELTRQLVDVPSVTGEEQQVGEFLFALLRREGWDCSKQEVKDGRFNVLARRGEAHVLLTTHLDTVPPFFPSREDSEFIYGRGACDAKGIAASMICAARESLHEGGKDLALLFVVGEETDSVGALKAAQLGPRCSFLIDGEPTDNELAIAHKGIVYARLRTRGIAAHSAYPEWGVSAIEILLDLLEKLRRTPFPTHERLGPTFVNIGTIRGGRASNVIPDEAEADILIRTVAESPAYLRLLDEIASGRGAVEIIRRSEPQEMESVEGFPTRVVGYGTDIPALRPLGRPLLFGPGSILEAHTADEKVAKRDLVQAVRLYKELIRKLEERRS